MKSLLISLVFPVEPSSRELKGPPRNSRWTDLQDGGRRRAAPSYDSGQLQSQAEHILDATSAQSKLRATRAGLSIRSGPSRHSRFSLGPKRDFRSFLHTDKSFGSSLELNQLSLMIQSFWSRLWCSKFSLLHQKSAVTQDKFWERLLYPFHLSEDKHSQESSPRRTSLTSIYSLEKKRAQ